MNNYDANEMEKKVLKIAFQVSDDLALGLRTIEFVRGDAFYGMCSPGSRSIKMKLIYSDGELIPEMEVWRTLAHELAHLKHPNHSHPFWVSNKEILAVVSELIGKKIRPEVAFTRDGVVY